MKSFIEYLNEAKKKPGILQRIFPKKANKTQWDSRKPKKEVNWQEREDKLNRDMNWTTNKDAGT
mgnify:CR=1 FL=1